MMYVALLRGINVGGDRKVDMKQLKATFERTGMDEVRTYINSGNVIFRSDSAGAGRLRETLENAIRADFGFEVRVVLRDADAMKALLNELPDTWANDKPAKCDVIFLGEDVDAPEVLEQLVIKPDIDEVRYVPGAVLWRAERSKVTRSGLMRLVGTELYAQTTVRNCNTLRKLAGMMQ
jgi:uncharacterized protein (DUF1697 family)